MRINLFSFFFSFLSFFLEYIFHFSPYYLPFSQINNNNFPYFSDFTSSPAFIMFAYMHEIIYNLFNKLPWGGESGNVVEMPTNQRSLPTSFSNPQQLLSLFLLSKCIIKLLARSFSEWTVYKTRKGFQLLRWYNFYKPYEWGWRGENQDFYFDYAQSFYSEGFLFIVLVVFFHVLWVS